MQLIRYSISLMFVGVVLFGYQNCSSPQTFAEMPSVELSSVAGNECLGHGEGSKWLNPSNELIVENAVCEYGGDLAYSYAKNIELTCQNGSIVPTGSFEKGAVVSQSGSCMAPNCNGKPEGTTWSVINGTVSEPKKCPSSSVVVNSIYNKVDAYICQSGKENITGSSKGDFVGLDQACPEPAVTATLSKSSVAVNSSVALVTSAVNVDSLNFSCTDGQGGSLPLASTSTSIKATQDLTCTVVGVNADQKSVSKSLSLSVTCGENEVKSGGKCVPYSCKSFVAISSFPFTVPARTVDGVCYYAKLFDKIATAPSSGSKMTNVISRLHGVTVADPLSVTNVATPYILGTFTNKFTLSGERTVKLSGSGSALSPILVDNYVLVGSRMVSSTAAISNYRAWGSADAAIGTTGKIKVNNADVALTAFESGGTATIGTLTLTSDFSVGQQYEININALDCGGSKAMSEIYLIFQ